MLKSKEWLRKLRKTQKSWTDSNALSLRMSINSYLQKENFYKIKANIENVSVERKTFDEMLCQKYDFMNLSDIFEYMDDSVMEEYGKRIQEHLNRKGIVAFWNMMNVRGFSSWPRLNGREDWLEDRAFFYRDFLVYEK